MTALAETRPEEENAAAAAPGAGRGSRLLILVVVPILAWLAWRALSWGVAGWLVAGDDPGEKQIHAALDWAPDHPRALFLAAQVDEADAPAEAQRHLERLLRTDPAHAWGWLLLAEITFRQAQDDTRSRAFLQQAQALAPWDGGLHFRAGDLWLQMGDLTHTVSAWDRAMSATPSLRATLFPRLLRLLEYLQDASLLAPVARRHPDWWPAFFRFAARPPTDLALVRALYALQGGDGEGRREERRIYLARLMEDGQWQEAYLNWLNDLSATERRHLGLVYNGGFELPLTQAGFDWRSAPEHLLKVERKRTYGVSGDRALALRYRGKAVPDWHLAQYLLLPPGRYRLTYRARPDSLKAAEGLRIAIRCRGSHNRRLAAGERLLGVYQWRHDVVELSVPEDDCPAQELGVVVVTERQRDRTVKGVLWLDDFRITPAR